MPPEIFSFLSAAVSLGTMAEGSKLGDPRPARDFHYSDHCFPACIGRFGHTKVARIILICAIFYGVPAGSNHQSAGVPEPGLMGRRQKFACQGLRTLWRRPSWVRIPPPAPEFALPIRTASFVWRIVSAFAWQCADLEGASKPAWETVLRLD